MNRLVIVGNGFDLAHGLPTGYCDFIDWYWRDVCEKIKSSKGAEYEDENIHIILNIYSFDYYAQIDIRKFFSEISTYNGLKDFFTDYSTEFSTMRKRHGLSDNYSFKIKNSFLELINDHYQIENWVDIENEYYKLLKDCLKEKDNSKVISLNEEFEQVKQLLETYLTEEVEQKFDFDNPNNKIYEMIDFFSVSPPWVKGDYNYLDEFPKRYHGELVEFNKSVLEAKSNNNLQQKIKRYEIVQTNLFLNFNYTKTIDTYIKIINSKNYFGDTYQNQIHGKLLNINCKINFGFGDEMDDDYSSIEKRNDNKYLKNIKSFQYAQTTNYKYMLDFLESGHFQVYVMGHSCGLSDRILLNKVFEHKNCASIKVFYHKFEKPKLDGRVDDFTDIIQNISRHFNKKEMMREKIVNKSLCQPLPQDIRFEEK